MKVYKFLLVAALFCLASCKDDDDSTTTSKSLTGTFDPGSMPEYVNPGDEYHFELSGLSLAEDETDDTIEILYTVKIGDEQTDTLDVNYYDLVIPDTLGLYSIKLSGVATGYNSKNVTIKSMVVGPGSITGTGRLASDPVMVDSRDSRKYFTSTIGSDIWMGENLAYFEKDAEGEYVLGQPYYGCLATETVFGGFYTWEDALGACPEGWAVPTVSQWDAIGDKAGDLICEASYNDSRMWEFWPEVKITNKYKFNAYPFGYATVVEGDYTFVGFGEYAFYWADDGGEPACRYILAGDPEIKVWAKPSRTDFAAQLRCVKK